MRAHIAALSLTIVAASTALTTIARADERLVGADRALAQAEDGAPDPRASIRPGGQAAEYRLRPGDVVKITVWTHDDLSKEYAIEDDGFIGFPLLGRVRAAGLTPRSLAARLKHDLEKDYLVNPQVIVAVAQYVFGPSPPQPTPAGEDRSGAPGPRPRDDGPLGSRPSESGSGINRPARPSPR